MPDTLLNIVPDRLSSLLKKGEITERYYNPGEQFDDVHILLTNDDQVDTAQLQPTAGDAQLSLHNHALSRNTFVGSLGLRPKLLKRWAAATVALARELKPTLVRCYGAHLNAFLANCIHRELGIPYVVSLHTMPDAHVARKNRTAMQKLLSVCAADAIALALREANAVVPVYHSITPYVERLGVPAERVQVIHNVVNPSAITRKVEYPLAEVPKILCVSRQFAGKNPDQVILAMADLQAELTLVGDGPIHDALRDLAAASPAKERIHFVKSMPNDKLCASLCEYDLFVMHCDTWGISKSMIEPMLAGLPVIVNRQSAPVPELAGDHVCVVENTADAYHLAAARLLADEAERETLGNAGFNYAHSHFDPAETEAKWAALYQQHCR